VSTPGQIPPEEWQALSEKLTAQWEGVMARPAARGEQVATPGDCFGEACEGLLYRDGYSVMCPLDFSGCPYQNAREGFRSRRFLRGLGFGARHDSPRLERVPAEPRQAISAYLEQVAEQVGAGIGLLLTGGAGSGKTSVLGLVALAYGSRAASYRTAGDLFSALHERGRGEEAVAAAAETPLLLLDDFGAAYESEWAIAQFDRIVDARYRELRATCIATNLRPEQLAAQPQWARAVSRWREMCLVVGFGDEDQRRRNLRREATDEDGPV